MSQMIEVKTANLIGSALDWAVGRALGAEIKPHSFCKKPGSYVHKGCTVFPNGQGYTHWEPSTRWDTGGPLIHKHAIELEPSDKYVDYGNHWKAHMVGENCELCFEYGETPLIAACRVIVLDAIGDTVQIPAELMP